MSDEDKQSVPEEGQNDESNDGTVTAEQFQELQAKYDQVLKAQSGSDKKVKELQTELKRALDEKTNTEKTAEQRLAEIESQLKKAEKDKEFAILRGRANELLSEQGVKTKFIDKLIGGDIEETEANVVAFIEEQKALKAQIADEFARQHGRKVHDSSQEGGLLTREQIEERAKDPDWYKANQDLIFRSLKSLGDK